ncbi:MAG: TIGR03084 family protein [Candidatus Abyssobacteria bacterium SURF_5]|uniref:TIGR03084 family protein n=1 Tax=Abyssobacteria bacterium (strain SURF_5) TaxID=2093360 RepID=A0A3A4NAK6_ABYX5|nr:MAG: TIGR03084 family protein [Candidatus Abyssubacteria bacterium SURF_5]
MKQICQDLRTEHAELDTVVAGLDEKQWMLMTPSPTWNIKNQIRHLAYFDDRAALAASDPDGFAKHIEEVMSDIAKFMKTLDEVGKDMPIDELMSWWRSERNKMLDAYTAMNPKDRILWYGPPMSALSHATARLMETWAHGQDVFDALRLKRTNTDRLRHIAHLGVKTFGWSYTNRGLQAPQTPVRVELTAPSGALWTWGPENASDKISGPAEDFCLIVAQRRHVDDTRLRVIGETARDWMLKAQCFAGPPTDGPPPGERVWEK